MRDIREIIDSAGEFTHLEAKEIVDLLRNTHAVKYIFSHLQFKMNDVLLRFPHVPLDLGEMGKLQGEIKAYQDLLSFFVLMMEEAETPKENEDEEND